jgi:DNA repair exonuclease SbcCD nuclease subunit
MVKFLHTSDWQVGMKGGGLGAAGDEVARARIGAVDRLLKVARERGADFVVACGDLFEHNDVAQEVVEEVARVLQSHRDVDIHLIPGNHDLPGPGSVWKRSALRAVPNLHCHAGTDPVLLGKATLHPCPVTSRYAMSDPLAALPDLHAEAGIHVGLAHGHLSNVTFGAHEEDIRLPLDPTHVDRCGLDYLALGHWHGTRVFRSLDGASRTAYSGTPEQTSFAETDAGNILLVEIAGKGVPPAITPIRVGGLSWADLAFAFAGDADVERLKTALEARPAEFLKLEVTGEAPSDLYPAFRALVEREEGARRYVRLDETVRWVQARAAAWEPPTDASLAEVDRLLANAAGAGANPEVVRSARELFRRLVDEVAP